MAIGVLFLVLGFAGFAVSLLGAASGRPESKPATDYKKIYGDVMPREL